MAVPTRTRALRAFKYGLKDDAVASHMADMFSAQNAALTAQLTTITHTEPSTPDYAVQDLTQGTTTAALTSITHTSPGTPDYAVQDLTQTTPFGFVTKDEGNTVLSVILNLQTRMTELEGTVGFGFASKDEGNSVLKVIANLQTRVAELEARLESAGLVATN